jgi:hypothetical protein
LITLSGEAKEIPSYALPAGSCWIEDAAVAASSGLTNHFYVGNTGTDHNHDSTRDER